MRIRHLLPVLPLAAALLAAPAAASASISAPGTSSPAATAAGIAGPCTPLQDGQYEVRGRGRNARLYECRLVRGIGYCWVEVPACPGGVSTAARPAC